MADRDTRTGIMTEEFFLALCAELRLTVTPRLRGFLTTWPKYEGVPVWIWNPMATTQIGHRSTVDVGSGPGKWNTANPPNGVGIYEDLYAGAQATAATITNGYYPELMATLLRGGVIANALTLSAEIQKWGTTGFADLIRSGWSAPLIGGPDTNTVPANVDTDMLKRVAVLEGTVALLLEMNPALQKRFAMIRLALDPDLPTVEQAHNALTAGGVL